MHKLLVAGDAGFMGMRFARYPHAAERAALPKHHELAAS